MKITIKSEPHLLHLLAEYHVGEGALCTKAINAYRHFSSTGRGIAELRDALYQVENYGTAVSLAQITPEEREAITAIIEAAGEWPDVPGRYFLLIGTRTIRLREHPAGKGLRWTGYDGEVDPSDPGSRLAARIFRTIKEAIDYAKQEGFKVKVMW